MFNQVITIYNMYTDSTTGYDMYKRTVIENAHWEDKIGIKLGGITLSEEKSIIVIIPLSTDGYVLPSNFNEQAIQGDGWTLQEKDFIVKGVHGEIEDFNDIQDLDFVMTIQSIETNDYARIKRLNNLTVNGK